MSRLQLYVPYTGNGAGASRNPVDPKRCRVEVWSKARFSRPNQCSGGALYDAVIDGQAVKVCGVHNPEKVAAREAASKARDEASRKAFERRVYRAGEYRGALQRIADGDNDPRALARAALDHWDDYQEPGV